MHWLFETHDNWIKSADCRLLLDAIPNPAFGALWDMGHTPRVGGETPAETYAAIGPRIGYTHVKDAVYEPEHPKAMQDGWRYVYPGAGQLPLADALNILRANGYDGWLMFEHEKRWHPNLPEPEEIFPTFPAWARPLCWSKIFTTKARRHEEEFFLLSSCLRVLVVNQVVFPEPGFGAAHAFGEVYCGGVAEQALRLCDAELRGVEAEMP